jgi:hypothetical protein
MECGEREVMWMITQAIDGNNIPIDKKRREYFSKKHSETVRFLDAKMMQIVTMLNSGMPLTQAMAVKWVHREQAGVHAVCSANPALRLYFYRFTIANSW